MMLRQGYQPKFDAAETAFCLAALSYVEAELYEWELPPLEGRLYVPVDNSAPPGALSTRYRMITRTGAAQFITEDTNDLPASSLFVREYSHDFQPIGMHYQYSYFDVLAAAMSSQNGGPPINLDLEEARGAREGIERKLDRISAFGSTDSGDPIVGLIGILNHPNANIYIVAAGMSGSTYWADKTPDEVLADLTGIIAAQIAGTFKRFKPTDLLLPILQHEQLSGRSMGDGRSETILSYFVRTRRESGNPITVSSWQHCSGAAANTTDDRMLAYTKNKRFGRHMISMEFTQLPPERKGMKWRTDCIAKTAGFISPWPISMTYGDSI